MKQWFSRNKCAFLLSLLLTMFVETLLAGVNATAGVFKLVVTVLIDCVCPEMPRAEKYYLLHLKLNRLYTHCEELFSQDHI